MNRGIFKIVLHIRFFILLPVLIHGKSFLPGKKEFGMASTNTLLRTVVSGLFYNAAGLGFQNGKAFA